MSDTLSDILVADYFNQVKYHLPISKRSDNVSIQNWMRNAMSRYNKLYVDYSLGIFDTTEEFDFYNLASLLNVRGLNTIAETRWAKVAPASFYTAKITSCRLKEVTPNDLVLPIGVSYIQDVPITVIDSKSVNGTVPSGNSGIVGLLGGRSILSALTLDMTGTGFSFSDVIEITAIYTFYRNVIYPNFSDATDTIDILKKDTELVANYVVEEAYSPNKAPIGVSQAIQDREFNLIYGS